MLGAITGREGVELFFLGGGEKNLKMSSLKRDLASYYCYLL